MKTIVLIIVILSLTSCTTSPAIKKTPVDIKATHLKDTSYISGNYVLFLRPDSLRFEHYLNNSDEGIYEADSDFGFGISSTFDSMSANKKYQNIKTNITTNRYIVIMNCLDCPLLIDRDTIDYGYIFSSKNKRIKMSSFIHSWNYLPEVNDYFDLKESN